MEDIHAIVKSIKARCASYGCEVSESLAAFVARTVVFDNTAEFRMDKDMNEDDAKRLVQYSVETLLQVDSPSLETIKMQVTFDGKFVEQEEAIETKVQTKKHKSSGLKRAIVDIRTRHGSDFENLTLLYRQIFQYLLLQSDVEAAGNRAVEREIAAALESVFPRVGLNSFIELTGDEKRNQLTELLSIVTGIRLFNRELGKGGAGLEDIAGIRRQVVSLKARLQDELNEITDVCQQYTDVLLYIQIFKAGESQASHVKRWQEELANRRQYLSYLQSLVDDIGAAQDRVVAVLEAFRREMSDLEALVGSKTSVPKEQVYPKFDSVALMYHSLLSEQDTINGREACWKTLQGFKNSFEASLTTGIVTTARSMGAPTADQLSRAAREFAASESKLDAVSPPGSPTTRDGATSREGKEGEEELPPAEVPVRLSIKSTPEFMQLPLEYQGYCPWSIVHRNGLLLQGNPALGVVRYRNSFNVFTHEEGLLAFMANPMTYVNGVLNVARKRVELIHLLSLQERFPGVSLSTGGLRGKSRGAHSLLAPAPVTMVDKSTGTPVHFIEKHIDPKYEWNEWALRRKALQIANLRKSKTISAQTDASHFKRESETQVYLPRIKATQTAVSTGTNPIRKVNYITGLRGGPSALGVAGKNMLTKFGRDGPGDGDKTEEKESSSHKSRVLTLALDL